MEYLTAKKFSFISNALPPDTFGVVSFRGSEAISQPYEFEIELVTTNLEIDLSSIIHNPGRLIIHRNSGDDVIYQGIPAHFEQLHAVGGFGFYRVRLVPKLWWLSLTYHNQVILNKSLPDFVTDVLKDGGLTTLDFEFRLQGNYDPIDYVCQYGESHLNFVSRWLEREGVYYFFEQTESGEKVIFTDTAIAHVDLPQGKTIYYSLPSGLDSGRRDEVVHAFNCRQKMVPASVFLKDYNYLKPSLDVSGNAVVDANGRGQIYYYHERFPSKEEGDRLAKIRAESILCRREEYRGEGSVPYMAPGFTFDLQNHFRKDFNQKYLTAEIGHEGDQTGYLISGIQAGLADREMQVYYRNSFTALRAGVQFRPEAKSEKPRMSGTIMAKIDAAGSGQYAELDEHGRYKIVLPFDLSGRKDGKASTWVRMAQPYAGSGHGMHFPLHKNTEVLLTFIDGDPDRPIIAAAVPNPETPSPVTSGNQTTARITTSGGNKIHIEDEEETQGIVLYSPAQESGMRLGSKSASDRGGDTTHDKEEDKGIAFFTSGGVSIFSHEHKVTILGNSTQVFLGIQEELVGALTFQVFGGGKLTCTVGKEFEMNTNHAKLTEDQVKVVIKAAINVTNTEVNNVQQEVNIAQNTVNVQDKVVEVHKEIVKVDEKALDLVNERLQAIENSINAMNQSITSANLSIDQLGTKILSMDTEISEAMQVIEKSGLKMQKIETAVKKGTVAMAEHKIELDRHEVRKRQGLLTVEDQNNIIYL